MNVAPPSPLPSISSRSSCSRSVSPWRWPARSSSCSCSTWRSARIEPTRRPSARSDTPGTNSEPSPRSAAFPITVGGRGARGLRCLPGVGPVPDRRRPATRVWTTAAGSIFAVLTTFSAAVLLVVVGAAFVHGRRSLAAARRPRTTGTAFARWVNHAGCAGRRSRSEPISLSTGPTPRGRCPRVLRSPAAQSRFTMHRGRGRVRRGHRSALRRAPPRTDGPGMSRSGT